MPAPEYIPGGYTAVSPYLVAEDVAGRIDFLATAFGAADEG